MVVSPEIWKSSPPEVRRAVPSACILALQGRKVSYSLSVRQSSPLNYVAPQTLSRPIMTMSGSVAVVMKFPGADFHCCQGHAYWERPNVLCSLVGVTFRSIALQHSITMHVALPACNCAKMLPTSEFGPWIPHRCCKIHELRRPERASPPAFKLKAGSMQCMR